MDIQDSTYIVQAERVTTTDTIYYQINKKDLKTLYGQVFDDMVNEDSAKDHITLTVTYIPLIIIFSILITSVNLRWNKAYKRIKENEPSADLSEEDKENVKKLDLQYYRIPDRIFFYLVVWVLSGIFDTLMVLNDIFEVPWAAILASLFTISKVMARLIGGSTLMGINDNDLIENYGKYIRSMLVDSIADKIKNLIKDK